MNNKVPEDIDPSEFFAEGVKYVKTDEITGIYTLLKSVFNELIE